MEEPPDRQAATLAAAGNGHDPELGLRAVAALRGLLETLEVLQVDSARAKGWSWRGIAIRLGVSKQAAHQKHGRGRRPRPGGGEAAASVETTEQAGVVPHLGRLEAERLRHRYLGPEHLLLGLLREGDDPVPHGDDPAARLLRRHGLGLATVRAEIDRLIASGVLPGPQPSDAELLASLGIDLDAVNRRIKEAFGWQMYYYAAQWVGLRSTHAFPRAPLGGTPLVCWRVLRLAADEAAARGTRLGPEHLLVGLLRDAQQPLETALHPQDRRLRGLLGLPDHGPHPIRLLVEARGLSLEGLLAAMLDELDQDR